MDAPPSPPLPPPGSVLVENNTCYEYFERCWESGGTRPDGAGVRWYTSSPFLFERLRAAGRDVRSLEDAVTLDEVNRLGRLVYRIALVWVGRLGEWYGPWGEGITFQQLFEAPIRAILNPVLFRGVVLDRWVEGTRGKGGGGAVVGRSELSNPSAVFDGSDCLFYALAREAGLEAKGFRLIEVPKDFVPRQNPVPRRHLSRSDRWYSMLMKLGGSPGYKAWTKILKGRALRLPIGGDSCGTVYIYRDNYYLDEIFSEILRRGVRVRLLKPVDGTREKSEAAGPGELRGVTEGLVRDYEKEVAEGCSTPGGPGVRAAGRLVVRRVLSYVESVRPRLQALEAHLKSELSSAAGGGRRRGVVLSNAGASPVDRFVFEFCKREGVPPVLLMHGQGAGLSLGHSVRKRGLDAYVGSAYVSFDDNSREFFEEVPDLATLGPILTGGAPKAIRKVPMRRLIRGLTRKRLGVGNDRVLLYAPTGFFGVRTRFPHHILDTEYHRRLKRMAHVVLPQAEGYRPIIKLYPKARHTDAHPLLTYAKPPGRVEVREEPDFRYLRAAADLLIVDVAMSTLTWALGARTPLIYVEIPSCPVLENIRGVLKESLFFVDAKEDGWEEELIRLVRLPYEEVLRRWEEKRESRRRFLHHCIFGPEPDPRRIVDFVLRQAG